MTPSLAFMALICSRLDGDWGKMIGTVAVVVAVVVVEEIIVAGVAGVGVVAEVVVLGGGLRGDVSKRTCACLRIRLNGSWCNKDKPSLASTTLISSNVICRKSSKVWAARLALRPRT